MKQIAYHLACRCADAVGTPLRRESCHRYPGLIRRPAGPYYPGSVSEPEYSFTPRYRVRWRWISQADGELAGTTAAVCGSNLVEEYSRQHAARDTQTLRLLVVDSTEDGKTQGGEATEQANYTVVYHQRRRAPPPPAARGGETGRPAAGDAFPDDDVRA